MTSCGQHLQIRAGALQFCCHRRSDPARANHQGQANPRGRGCFDHVILLRGRDRLAEIRHHRLEALLSSSGALSPSFLAPGRVRMPAHGCVDRLVGSATPPAV